MKIDTLIATAEQNELQVRVRDSKASEPEVLRYQNLRFEVLNFGSCSASRFKDFVKL